MNGVDSTFASGPLPTGPGPVPVVALDEVCALPPPSLAGHATRKRASVTTKRTRVCMRSSYANSRLPGSLDRSGRRAANVDDAGTDEEVVNRALVGMDGGEAEACCVEEREGDVSNRKRGDEAL